MQYENKVKLIGDVVHIFKGKNIAILTLKTIYGSKVPNYPQVKVYGNAINKVNNLLNCRVEVDGYIETENIKGKTLYEVVALSIITCKKPSLNEVHLTGYITKIEENTSNTLRIFIKTLHGKYRNIIETFLYTKNVGEMLEKYKVGDRVSVYGNIQTKKRVYPDVVKYYSDITLRDVRKIEE